MTLKEAIQKDSKRHLYVKSAITSGTIQYLHCNKKIYCQYFLRLRICMDDTKTQ